MKQKFLVFLRSPNGSSSDLPLGTYDAEQQGSAIDEALRANPQLREKLDNGTLEIAAKPALY